MGTCPPSSMWGLPAFTVPLHHAPVPEEQGPDAHGEQAVACGESSAGSAPARDTGRPCFFSRSIIHLLCKYPRNMDKGEGESPRDPLPEMAHIFLDFFFFFLSLWNVHRPPPLHISFFAADHSLSHSSTLQAGNTRLPQLLSHRRGPCGCNTSVPMPVSVRYRPGRDCRRAHESTGLYLGALAPHLLEGCLVPSRPFLMRKVGVHGWVPAPWWPLAAWATSLCAAHSGMDRAARGKQYPAGAAYCPLGSWGVAAPGPAGSTQALPPLTQTPGYRLP